MVFEIFKKLLRDAQDAYTNLKKARRAHSEGRLREALQHYEEAVKKLDSLKLSKDTEWLVLFDYGLLKLLYSRENSEFEEVAKHFAKLAIKARDMKAREWRATALWELAIALALSNKRDKALKVLEEVEKEVPESRKRHVKLLRKLLEGDRRGLEEAVKELEKVADNDPTGLDRIVVETVKAYLRGEGNASNVRDFVVGFIPRKRELASIVAHVNNAFELSSDTLSSILKIMTISL